MEEMNNLLHVDTGGSSSTTHLCRSRVRPGRLCTILLMAGCLASSAQAQQKRQQPKPTITLPSLTAQGFEIKASIASYLVLQKGKDVWLCYMLTTRSTCEPAE
jgi:hypothetical protein